MKKKVFITGGNGFLGSYLIRLLIKQGYNVKAIKRENSSLELIKDIEDKVEWVIGDIRDSSFLDKEIKNIDWVFHCAAIVSFAPKDIRKMLEINVEGTSNIVNSCLYHSTKKLIHTSSIAAIGRPENNNTLITENTKWQESKLNTAYAKSKFLSELEVWRGHAEGLNIGIINPSVIIGSGFWNSGSCKLFSQVYSGLKFYPTGATGFVDVRDVASAMLKVAVSKENGERYIINGTNAKYQDFFNHIALEFSLPKPHIKVSPVIQHISWRLAKIKGLLQRTSPLITKETAKLSSLQYSYSNQKSIDKLDMNYYSLEQTIEETCQFFLDYQKSKSLKVLHF